MRPRKCVPKYVYTRSSRGTGETQKGRVRVGGYTPMFEFRLGCRFARSSVAQIALSFYPSDHPPPRRFLL